MIETITAILRDGWGMLLLRGAVMTVVISLLGMALGMLIGLAGASIKVAGERIPSLIVGAYTSVVRSVPELLIIYLLFFGSIQTVADLADRFDMDSLMSSWFPAGVGVVAIALISGSYCVEVFRGALKAIPVGQLEATRSIGMGKATRLLRVVIPQMLWYALPGLNNIWQTALKDTALISLVGLVELMRASVLGAAATREPLALYLMAGVLYFAIALGSQVVFVTAEAYYGRGMKGR